MKTKPFEPPFRYEKEGQWIYDSNEMHVLTVRGWGALTGTGGGLGLPEDDAAKLQDDFGEAIVTLMNEHPHRFYKDIQRTLVPCLNTNCWANEKHLCTIAAMECEKHVDPKGR